jgi:hypothetical protein
MRYPPAARVFGILPSRRLSLLWCDQEIRQDVLPLDHRRFAGGAKGLGELEETILEALDVVGETIVEGLGRIRSGMDAAEQIEKALAVGRLIDRAGEDQEVAHRPRLVVLVALDRLPGLRGRRPVFRVIPSSLRIDESLRPNVVSCRTPGRT